MRAGEGGGAAAAATARSTDDGTTAIGCRGDGRSRRRTRCAATRSAHAAFADSALVAVDEQLRAAPNDAQRHSCAHSCSRRSAGEPKR